MTQTTKQILDFIT